MTSEKELDHFCEQMRSIQQDAMRVLRSADACGMSYKDIAKTYGVGGSGGQNVGFYLKNPISLSAAIQVLRMETSGTKRQEPEQRKGAAATWGVW